MIPFFFGLNIWIFDINPKRLNLKFKVVIKKCSVYQQHSKICFKLTNLKLYFFLRIYELENIELKMSGGGKILSGTDLAR